MKVTLKDIAGVSISTVSRVLNDDKENIVNSDTKQLVWKLVKEMGYTKSKKQNNIKKNTKEIGIIFNGTKSVYNHPYFSALLRAIELEVKDQGYTIGFSICEADIKNKSVLHNVLTRNVDGIIIASLLIDNELLNDLNEHFENLVFIDTVHSDLGHDLISVEKEDSTYKATRYLIDFGHKKIAFLGSNLNNEKVPSFKQEMRLNGFLRAMNDSGIPVENHLLKDARWTLDGGYKQMKKILNGFDRPTAVFSASDMMAIGAMRAIQEAGLNIPEDISIISYDDIDMARFTHPPLTTLHVFKEDIGKLAVKMLIERINGDAPEMPIKVFVPTELKIRETVAKPIKKPKI